MNRSTKAISCSTLFLLAALFPIPAMSQDSSNEPSRDSVNSPQPQKRPEPALDVNWIYGAYVPRDASLEPLTGRQRFKLYLRQSYTTPGIYAKTTIFVIKDQAYNDPEQWGGGVEGFAKRFGSRQGQFVIQNSLSALGDAIVGFEPRYDRCRCDGFGARTKHAFLRNFLTYNRTESQYRPRVPLYIAAFGAGAIASTWKPGDQDVVEAGLNGIVSQLVWGSFGNFIGEFAPDALRYLKARKAGKSHAPDATSRD